MNKLKRAVGRIKTKISNRSGQRSVNKNENIGNFRTGRAEQRTPLQKGLFFAGIIITVILAVRVWNNTRKLPTTNIANIEPKERKVEGETSSKVPVAEPLMTTEINREFTFSFGKGAQEKEDGEGEEEKEKEKRTLIYKLQKAELTDEIIVQGKKVNTIEGRTFLIFTLALTNDNTSPLEIKSRDFVRLQVGNSEERFAPDIHNDPVTVQAASTKYTRLGFPVDEGITDFTLYVGKIAEEKETVEVSF